MKRISQDPWTPLSGPGEPTWEVARFYPRQGEWTEADYLALPTNQLVELSDGRLEFLPMPKHFHQMIVAFLYGMLKAFVDAHAPGVVLFAPLPVHLWKGKYREPDLLYMRAENKSRIGDYWEGADLVMEVPSESNPEHDRDTKRREYAQAKIPEYWIVDVFARRIVVLTLHGEAYRGMANSGPAARRPRSSFLTLPWKWIGYWHWPAKASEILFRHSFLGNAVD